MRKWWKDHFEPHPLKLSTTESPLSSKYFSSPLKTAIVTPQEPVEKEQTNKAQVMSVNIYRFQQPEDDFLNKLDVKELFEDQEKCRQGKNGFMQVVTEKSAYSGGETVHGIIYIRVNPPMFEGERL